MSVTTFNMLMQSKMVFTPLALFIILDLRQSKIQLGAMAATAGLCFNMYELSPLTKRIGVKSQQILLFHSLGSNIHVSQKKCKGRKDRWTVSCKMRPANVLKVSAWWLHWFQESSVLESVAISVVNYKIICAVAMVMLIKEKFDGTEDDAARDDEVAAALMVLVAGALSGVASAWCQRTVKVLQLFGFYSSWVVVLTENWIGFLLNWIESSIFAHLHL